jgi:hypothetical protein
MSGVLVWQLTGPITSLFSQEMQLLSAGNTKSRRNLEHEAILSATMRSVCGFS